MEHDGLGLDLSVLDVDLVPGQDDRDVGADANEISVPFRNVLVGDERRHVKHDDGTLGPGVVAVMLISLDFLAGCVPHVEADDASVCVKDKRVDLDSDGCDVFVLKLAGQVTLHKRRFAGTAVADDDQLEGADVPLALDFLGDFSRSFGRCRVCEFLLYLYLFGGSDHLGSDPIFIFVSWKPHWHPI